MAAGLKVNGVLKIWSEAVKDACGADGGGASMKLSRWDGNREGPMPPLREDVEEEGDWGGR